MMVKNELFSENAPKAFWNHTNKKYEKKSSAVGYVIDECNERFKNEYGGSMEPPREQRTNLGDNLDPDLDSEISDSEIKRNYLFIENGKSCGLDWFSAELLKHSYGIISPFLIELFNHLFANGKYPSTWAEGTIVPIFKSGDSDEVKVQRPYTDKCFGDDLFSDIIEQAIQMDG